jgi:hypothetical protein
MRIVFHAPLNDSQVRVVWRLRCAPKISAREAREQQLLLNSLVVSDAISNFEKKSKLDPVLVLDRPRSLYDVDHRIAGNHRSPEAAAC